MYAYSQHMPMRPLQNSKQTSPYCPHSHVCLFPVHAYASSPKLQTKLTLLSTQPHMPAPNTYLLPTHPPTNSHPSTPAPRTRTSWLRPPRDQQHAYTTQTQLLSCPDSHLPTHTVSHTQAYLDLVLVYFGCVFPRGQQHTAYVSSSAETHMVAAVTEGLRDCI